MDKNNLEKAKELEKKILTLKSIEQKFEKKKWWKIKSSEDYYPKCFNFFHNYRLDSFNRELPIEMNEDILSLVKEWREKYEKELEEL